MDWERDEENPIREFTLYCGFSEMDLLTKGIEQLYKAISEGQKIAGMEDLSDMDQESKEDFRNAINELKEELEGLWESV